MLVPYRPGFDAAAAEQVRAMRERAALRALSEVAAWGLDTELIVRRGAWILGSLLCRGAVAYLETTAHGGLRCVHQAASDRLLVAVGLRAHRSWSSLLERGGSEVVELRRRPERGQYPGLEPLWHRFEPGAWAALAPVWGRGRAIGALVLAELERGRSAPFGGDTVAAAASMLGLGLEEASQRLQVRRRAAALEASQDRLIEAERFAAVGLLAAQLAHEINNPASFVISNLSVMIDYVETIGAFLDEGAEVVTGEDPALALRLRELAARHEVVFLREDLDALLDRSLAGMQRIHQVIRDLRYVAHSPGGSQRDQGWVDVDALLQAAVNLVRHEAKYRTGIEFDLHAVGPIFSDAHRLSQVFLNLLVNAVQAIEPDAPQANTIWVRTRPCPEGGVAVTIEDTGRGIAPGDVGRVFEPFFTTKPRGIGTGLGLSITAEIVRDLGGQIRVSTELGRGATFIVELPRCPPGGSVDTEPWPAP